MPTTDLEKQRRYRREWYARNSEHAKTKVTERRRIRRAEMQIWFRSLKTQCNRCPENNPSCLVFHHVDPSTKTVAIAQTVSRGWSKERILTEINKCEVLCANCHMKEHALLG